MSTIKTNIKLRHQATSAFTIASLLTIGLLPFSSTVVAQSAPAGTVINNFSTATYEDPLNQTTIPIVSNNVILTIAEIAGVTVVGTGIDANPNINSGDIIYFNFTINNVGNDPTQFFIPSLPKSVSSLGTFNATTIGSIEIVETKDASGVVIPLPGNVAKISVPATGGITSPSVPAGGTVRIRVPVQVAAGATTGSTITVVMGDAVATNSSNQVYVAGTNKDLYTIDNTITPLPAGEISGVPTNGTRESSASQDAIINPIVIPTDFGELPSSYKTTLIDNGARHSIVPGVYLGAGITAETDGSPVISPANITTADNNGVIFDPVYGQQILRASTIGDTLNTIKITASTAGYINAWIDLNGNGTFDPADRVLTEVAVIAGDNSINITLPNTVINGNTYARFRFTTGTNQAVLSTGLAPNGEVEDYQIQIVKSSATPTTTSLCTERGGTTTSDNLIFGGNFPTTGEVEKNIAGATTGYVYDANATWNNGWPNDNSTSPIDGRYLVTSGTGPNTYNSGAWHDLSEHTGDGGGMMVVNGNSSSRVIETTINNLTIGKTYEFSTWVANLATAAGGSSLPDLKLEYSTDGTTWNLVTSSGSIAKTINPEWNIYGNFFTATATSVKIRISNNQTGSTGNDFAIDDLRLSGCDVPLVSGRVFEDVNYGGGDGRNYTTAKNNSPIIPVEVQNAVIELYEKQPDNSFKKVAQRSTIGDGSYRFTTADGASYNGIYRVRAIDSTVKSNRPGSIPALIPVQTFRKDPSAAIPEIITEVGGTNPQLVDATAVQATGADFTALTTTTTVAQSSTPATMNNAEVKNLDFGFNFDTIVNTNDGGQGSLRQFIDNSNALTNANLAQAGLTKGKEVSIFMIPGQTGLSLGAPTTTTTAGIRAGVANQLTNGVAIIQPTTPLPLITDANTSIDGSTQTTNVGDTNTGTFGYVGLVGTGADGVSGTGDETSLAAINKPEIEIQGISGNVLEIQGVNAIVRGVAIRGAAGNPTGILSQSGANNFLVENSVIGSGATTFADPGASNRLTHGISASGTDNIIVRNNLVGFAGSFGVISSSSNTLVERNRFAAVGLVSLLTSRSEQMRYSGNGPATIKHNYFDSTTVGQIDLGSGQNVLVDNNTLENGHYVNSNDSYENAAIHARSGATNITISHNIIRNTQQNAHGIMVHSNGYGVAANRVKITKNSIFNSGKLGINLNPAGQVPTNTDDGVTPNDGLTDINSGNNGIDYPIITSSKLSGNTLTVKGYVGNVATGSTTFGTVTVEFFVGAADTNDRGKIFITDPNSVSKIHAEGQTYLGSCTTDPNGLFGTVANPCAFSVPTGTNPLTITSTATDSLGNTSEFSAEYGGNPSVLLVKRITNINNQSFTTYKQENANPYDDNELEPALAPNDPTSIPRYPTADTTHWPDTTGKATSTFLVGEFDGMSVKPNDSIEYTIYFLSTGTSPANNVLFCDRVPDNVTFSPNTFTNTTANPTGVARGIAVKIGNTLDYRTNTGDTDLAQYFPPGIEPSTVYPTINCGGANNNGAVVVKLGDLNNSTGAGTPPESSGFVRFRGVVK